MRLWMILFVGCVLLVLAGAVAHADTVAVSDRAGLGGDDVVDWGSLGTPVLPLGSSFTHTSAGGVGLTVSQPSGDTTLYVTSLTAPGVYDFALGDYAIDARSDDALTIEFDTAVFGAGAQIITPQAISTTVTASAYDSLGNLLETSTVAIHQTNSVDNSAPFVGFLSDTANISRIVYDTAGTYSYVAMNQMDLVVSGSPVPEPTTLALFGLGAGVLALRRRKRSIG